MDLLKGNGKDFHFGDTQEAAFLKIVVLFTSGNTPILRHFDQERPAMIEKDELDFTIVAGLSQKLEDRKIHPCAFLPRKLSPAEFNYDVFDKDMLAIIYSLQKWRHYVLGTEHKTMIFSDHQNLEYFTKKVKLNRRQARWAEILFEFDFVIIYRKGSLNQKADILSRYLAHTFREGGTTAISEKPMLGLDQGLEVGAMEIFDETSEYIDIGALDVVLLSSDQKEAIIPDARLDDEYMQLCKAVSKGEMVDANYTIQEELVAWKGRIYIPKAMRKQVMKSEHDSQAGGHFGRD
jgi:hypothetical protein